MIASATLTLDREYYSQHYSAWLEYRSGFYLMRIFAGLFLVCLGIYHFQNNSNAIAFSGLLVAIGLLGATRDLWGRSINIKRNLRHMKVSTMEIELHDDRLKGRSDLGTNDSSYDAFKRIHVGKHGISFITVHRVSIFVPWSALEPQSARAELEQKFAA